MPKLKDYNNYWNEIQKRDIKTDKLRGKTGI